MMTEKVIMAVSMLVLFVVCVALLSSMNRLSISDSLLMIVIYLALIAPSQFTFLLYAGQPNSPPVSMCSCRISQ